MKLCKKIAYALFLLPLISVMLLAGSAVADTYTITNLTSSTSESASGPRINSSGQVVWIQGNDIYLYDGATTTNLIDNSFSVNVFAPQINDNGQAVWSQSNDSGTVRDIYLYDGATTTNLTNNNSYGAYTENPQINDSGHVVWSQQNGSTTAEDVYLYNGVTIVNLTNNSYNNPSRHPQINNSGQVVWIQMTPNNNTYYYNIYLYDGATTTNLTNNSSSGIEGLQINDSGQVVWDMGNNVYLYDGATTTNLTNNTSGYPTNPQINNNGQVVWDMGNNVYFYDGATTTKLTNNSYDGGYVDRVHINDNGQVVWAYQGDIYLYDGVTTTNLTDYSYGSDSYGINNVRINNDGQVVWAQSSAASGSDIYLAVNGPCVDGTYVIDSLKNNNSSSSTASSLQVNNNGQVVWSQSDTSSYGNRESYIYFYNGTTTISLPTSYSYGYYDYKPKINDSGQVAWYQQNNSTGTGAFDVYLYSGTATTNLSNNSYSGYYAPIYNLQINNNGQVVWTQLNNSAAIYDIYLFDGTTITNLTNNTSGSYDFNKPPRINDNGQVVWYQLNNSTGAYDVYLYSGTTTTNLTNNTSSGVNFENLQINDSGQVLWSQSNAWTSTKDIYLYDGATTTNLTNNTSGTYPYYPQINDNGQVVWCQGDNIYFYDGATTTNLSNNSSGTGTPVENPQINNRGHVVWTQRNNSTSDIYLYDGATTTNLSNNSYGTSIGNDGAQISNSGHVVWYQQNSSTDGTYRYDVYLYDGATTTNLTNNTSYRSIDNLKINDIGQVVWRTFGSGDWVFLAVPCVNNQPPVVNAAGSQSATEGDVVTFTGSYTDEDQADSHTYSWNFGDGSASVTDTLTPSHTYADNGTYTVTLTVTDSAGNSSSSTLTVTVTNSAPAVNAGADQSVTAGDTVSFNGSYTDAGANDTHTIEWDIDGDGVFDYNGSLAPSHVYQVAGSYTVTLQVTDDDGDVGSDTLTIEVKEPDTAPPSVTILGDNPVTIELGAVYTDAGATALDTVDGDLTASINTYSTVNTSTAGVYTVTYTVTDAAGNTATVKRTVNVVDPLDIDNDNDGYTENQGDCDDTNASVNPGATEVAYNGKDDDCNAATPDDDLDGDGYDTADDCDDTNAAINPGATETCDGVDNNCNSQIDENVKTTYYRDADGDGYGDPNTIAEDCTQPSGYVTDNTDCNDTNAAVHPGAQEIAYDGIDQDCNGSDLTDADGDGCLAAEAGGSDCNDNDASVHPGATEVTYNGKDDDCNAATPDDDLDGDGYGIANDCNDADATINPGAAETCDGVDNNCNGQIDENAKTTYYRDADGDGYGDSNTITEDCTQPSGYVTNNTDCNDNNAAVHPGATEIANNDIDEDCDGADLRTSEYTQPGTDVVVQPVDSTTGVSPVTITFGEVTQSGETTISGTSTPPVEGGETPPGFKMPTSTPVYYELSTTAVFQGAATVCFTYPADVPSEEEAGLKLFHYENSAWVDVTTSLDTVNNVVCGEVTSFSPFGVFVANQTPEANAGVDQSVNVGDTVTLNGGGSLDADGDAITYSWSITTKPSGSTAELSGAETASPTFTADVAGTYVAQLVVDDGAVSSSPDTVTITANEDSEEEIEVEVDIKPETINLRSKGKFKAFIELPDSYNADEVVLATIVCEGAQAVDGRVDDEGRYIATFNTQDLHITVSSKKEEVTLTVTGELEDGTKFTGSDTVKVKSKEKEKGKDKDK